VTITVGGVNDAPVAVDDSANVNQDTNLIVPTASGVLGNDTDSDGDALKAVKVSDPAHGSVTLNDDGSYTYVPAAAYSGPDSFTYKANDGTADSNVATVNIAVAKVAGAGDTVAPVFLSASLTNTTFRVNAKGAPTTLVTAKAAKKGTKFVYTLSEKARVLFTIQSRRTGRSVGGKCVKTTKKNKGQKHCTRFVKLGSFAQNGAAGANTKSFSGKLGRKGLKPGRYRAVLTAKDASGNASKAKRLSFKVVR
jgi:VCBS repeat-containing protein